MGGFQEQLEAEREIRSGSEQEKEYSNRLRSSWVGSEREFPSRLGLLREDHLGSIQRSEQESG